MGYRYIGQRKIFQCYCNSFLMKMLTLKTVDLECLLTTRVPKKQTPTFLDHIKYPKGMSSFPVGKLPHQVSRTCAVINLSWGSSIDSL